MLYFPLLKITPYGWGFIAIIIFSILITIAIFKRRKTRPGCVAFGYVSLVVFCISLFTFFISGALLSYTVTKVDTVIHGKTYTATIVDYERRESTDDENNTTISYYPVVTFITAEGRQIIRTLDESTASGVPRKGDTKTVYYYAEKDKLTTIGAMTFIAFFGMLFMGLVLVFVFVGIIMYAFGYKMEGFYNACRNFGLKIFVPALMIAFDALLIFALFYGNTDALWVKVLLIFFIIMLSLAIIGYIKMNIKGELKFRRVSPTRWEGDWE